MIKPLLSIKRRKMTKTPVLITFFNRPDNLSKLLIAISLRDDLDFYFAADGPRHPEDKQLVDQCWQLIKKYLPEHKESKCLTRDSNLGCKLAMKGNIDWFFTQVERGIILEDDCIPNSDFFDLIIPALHIFDSRKDIFGISGSDFIKSGESLTEMSFRLSRFPMVWGWATWSDRWDKYKVEIPDGSEVTKITADRLFNNKINPRYWFFRMVFERRFLEVEKGIIDTWDYSLVATLWRHDMKFLQLNGNSVVNVGFDHRATHTKGRAPIWVPIAYSKNISKNINVSSYNPLNDLWLTTNVFNCTLLEVIKILLKRILIR